MSEDEDRKKEASSPVTPGPSSPPAAAAPASAPRGDDARSPATDGGVHAIFDAKKMSAARDFIVNLGGFAAATERVLAPPAWTDPTESFAARVRIPDVVSELVVERSVTRLQRDRILSVECIDGTIQWEVAQTLVMRLPAPIKALRSTFEKDCVPDPGATALPASAASDRASRWVTSILREELGGGGRAALFLELAGEDGQTLVDRIRSKSAIAFTSLSEKLAKLDRYLVLLPQGPVARSLRHLDRDPLVINFLEPWLRFHSVSDVPGHLAAIAKSWKGSDEALHTWLSAHWDRDDTRTLLEQLAEGGPEPKPSTEVAAALYQNEGRDEPLLAAASFVAAHMPALPQHDFDHAVEALLKGRTRTIENLQRAGEGGRNAPAEVACVNDWRQRFLVVMKTADLVVTAKDPGGRQGKVKTVSFRDPRAEGRLRELFGETPMFLDQQLEKLRAGGVFFHRSPPLREAALKLVLGAVADEPDRYDADWLLELIRPAFEGDVPSMISTRSQVRRLLQGLIPAQSTDEPSSEVSLVPALLNRLLGRQDPSAEHLLLDVAYYLRDASTFDTWYWIRQVLERGQEASRDTAKELLQWMVQSRALEDPNRDLRPDLEKLIGWLPEPDRPPGRAGEAVAAILAGWSLSSINFRIGPHSRRVGDEAAFVRRLLTGEDTPAILLLKELFHPRVARYLREGEVGDLEAVAALCAPQDAVDVEDPRWLQEWAVKVFDKWNDGRVKLIRASTPPEVDQHLRHALLLAVWSELLSDDRDRARRLAGVVNAETRKEVQLAIRGWLRVLVEAIRASHRWVADFSGLDGPTRATALPAMLDRRLRLESFTLQLGPGATRGGGP